MPFRVIRGLFHVKGYSPDGDSIRFEPLNPSKLDLLDGPPAKMNARGHVQLRLEAIDTLETHFQGSHQPLEFARKATDHLMAQLGVTGIVWNAAGTKVEEANDGVPGYIVSREVERNRRPVAFAYSGTPAESDGASLFLDAARVALSANAEMLRSGLAYPTYYKGLFSDLRVALTGLVTAAKAEGRGLWPHDKTMSGCEVTGMASITEEHVIIPKLFRRLADYLEAGGPVSGFKAFLEGMEEEVLVISTAHTTHYDTVVDVTGNVVKMTEPPENLIFRG
jgi:hypothetical protein